MTRRETEETALRQSARDYGCAAGDFLQKSPKVVCAPVPEGRKQTAAARSRRFCRNANRGIALSFPPSAR